MKKIALVTGAAGGIGQAIVCRLAKEGMKVYANARSEEKLKKTLELCKGCDVEPLVFDVTDLADAERKIMSLEGIDYLVNNAGKSIRKKSIGDLTEEDWDSILDTNAKGYFFMMKYAIRKMKKDAAIVNLTSGAAKTGGDFVSIPYSSSKGAINALTISMARELAPRGIRVNAVSPGFVDTDMLTLNGKERDYYPPIIPLGRLGTTEDISNAVYFLLSDEASFMTGQIIEVNGGDIMG